MQKKFVTYECAEYDEDGREIAHWIQSEPEPACKLCKGKMWQKEYHKETFTKRRGKLGRTKESKELQNFSYVMCKCHPSIERTDGEEDVVGAEEQLNDKKALYTVYKELAQEATDVALNEKDKQRDSIITRNKKRLQL